MTDDDADELGEAGDQLNGIADRLARSDDSTETSGTSETSGSKPEPSVETSETTTLSEMTGATETSEASGAGELNIRDDWNGRTIYLPDDVVDDLDYRYDEANLKWRREHGEKLPKNERFYPAVVRAALNETSIEAELGLSDDV